MTSTPYPTSSPPAAAPGNGGVPLVLLPGTLCDARLFAPLLARLPLAEAHVLPLAGGTDTGAVAEWLLARAPAQFALLGFSLGGIVALEVAARAPERVAGLALIGGNARGTPPGDGTQHLSAWITDAPIDAHIRERLWASYVSAAAQGDAALLDRVADMAAATAARLPNQLAIMTNRADSRPRLAALTMPALVLAGAEDALCPPFFQRELALGLPDATLALVPGAGHFVPMEAPDETAAHVAAWLARAEAHARPCYTTTLPQEAS